MSKQSNALRAERRAEPDPILEAAEERREGADRRRARRLRVSLEIAVPVTVRSEHVIARGLARNISEGGMLIELRQLPPIGSEIEITIAGVGGSSDAPEAIRLLGEVRHHVAWQFAQDRSTKTLRGAGVRFLESSRVASEPITSWIFSAGWTVHLAPSHRPRK